MTKAQQRERAEARDQLLKWLNPGDTVYTIMDHVSASGMMRAIRVLVPTHTVEGAIDFVHPNYSVGKLLGLSHWTRNGRTQDALKVTGCGMDMGFHLVYGLSSALWPDGFECIGVGCPANDHSNGDRDHTPHTHRDGGYALRHRWL